jgi:hypothetical protein
MVVPAAVPRVQVVAARVAWFPLRVFSAPAAQVVLGALLTCVLLCVCMVPLLQPPSSLPAVQRWRAVRVPGWPRWGRAQQRRRR